MMLCWNSWQRRSLNLAPQQNEIFLSLLNMIMLDKERFFARSKNMIFENGLLQSVLYGMLSVLKITFSTSCVFRVPALITSSRKKQNICFRECFSLGR